jgi:ATP-dependent Clp protease adaptor protein ClpS
MAETTTAQQAPPEPAPPEPATARKSKASTDARPKRQPPYAVVLHNDPINEFPFVVGVLRKVFRYGGGKCFWLTLQAHVAGRSIVWTGTLEVAELKAEQIAGCGHDPSKPWAPPLKTTVEPLPD